jgi:hypothetical protein
LKKKLKMGIIIFENGHYNLCKVLKASTAWLKFLVPILFLATKIVKQALSIVLKEKDLL